MGRFFFASCTCGYESEKVYNGRGIVSEASDPAMLAICLGCRTIFTTGITLPDPPSCAACGSKDVLPTVRVTGTDASDLEVIGGYYPCPACNRWMLKIHKGHWS